MSNAYAGQNSRMFYVIAVTRCVNSPSGSESFRQRIG
jgi:hypothetical protein